MTIVYDRYFNKNEWFVIISLIVGITLVFIYRKRFTLKEVVVYSLYSVFIGMAFDYTISITPFDFYDVNNSSAYELMDFLTYLMYAPYGYFYIYFYDYFKIKNSLTPVYILLWALLSVAMELIADYMGVFHYKGGYKLYYSFPTYLFVLSLHIGLYKLIRQTKIRVNSH